MNGLQNYRRENRRTWPNFSLVHCTYCFPEITGEIKKLEAASHHEWAFEPWINPSYIVATVLCHRDILWNNYTLTKYPGSYSEFVPFDHPEFDFLKKEVPFRDLELASRENITRFMQMINCSVDVDWDKLNVRKDPLFIMDNTLDRAN
jgi:hypothetical protein